MKGSCCLQSSTLSLSLMAGSSLQTNSWHDTGLEWNGMVDGWNVPRDTREFYYKGHGRHGNRGTLVLVHGIEQVNKEAGSVGR